VSRGFYSFNPLCELKDTGIWISLAVFGVRTPFEPLDYTEKVGFVFRCYLDDSGTSGLVTLAGFVAPLNVWEGIEPLANAVMDGYGVPIFHAKEFHDTKGCFARWSRIFWATKRQPPTATV
jgi:hypothetical protein